MSPIDQPNIMRDEFRDPFAARCRRIKSEAGRPILADNMAFGPKLATGDRRFHIYHQLGQGGQGEVYAAWDRQVRRFVAIKLFRPLTPTVEIGLTRTGRGSLLREIRRAAEAGGANVISVYDLVDSDSDLPYMVMEYAAGGKLSARALPRLAHGDHSNSTPGENAIVKDLVHWVEQVTVGLVPLHRHPQPRVHRDIKPDNILLVPATPQIPSETDHLPKLPCPSSFKGLDLLAKIADFGAAGPKGPGPYTLGYAAPEVVQENTSTPQSDVFSVGATLRYLLTGLQTGTTSADEIYQPPTEVSMLSITGVTRDLAAIICKAVAPSPSQRYASAVELGDDLRRFLNNDTVSARPIGTMEWVFRKTRKHPTLAGLLVTAIAFLFVGVVAVIMFRLWQQTVDARDGEATQRRINQRGNARQLHDAAVTHARFGDLGLSILLDAQGLKLLPDEDTNEATAAYHTIALKRSQLAPLRYIQQFAGGIRAGGVAAQRSLAIVATTNASILIFDLARSPMSEPVELRLAGSLDRTAISSIAIRPDGSRFAVATISGWIHIFDTDQKKEIASFQHLGRPMGVAYSHDGQTLVVAAHRNPQFPHSEYLTAYNVESKIKTQFPIHEELYAASYSPNGEWLACCGEIEPTPKVTLFHGGKLTPIVLKHATRIFTLAFSPDSQTLVTGGVDGVVRFWRLTEGQWVEDGLPISLPKQVRLLAFDALGERLLTGSEDGTARLWNARSRRPIAQTLYHLGEVRVGGISTASARVLTGDDVGNIRVWELPKTDPFSVVLRHPAPVWDVDFNADGTKLLTGCLNAVGQPGAARIWDLSTWNESQEPIVLTHGSDISVARFHPDDSNTVVTAGNNKLVRIWNVKKRQEERKAIPHHSFILTGGFSPDGRYFAFSGRGNAGNQFRVWDLKQGQEVLSANDPGGVVRSFFWNLSFTRDGRLLTDGGDKARLWKITDGRLDLVHKFGHTETNKDIFATVSPNGQWAVAYGREAGNKENRAVVWDLWDPKQYPHGSLGDTTGTHLGRMTAALFHPRKPILATASIDGAVRLWGTDGSRAVDADLQHESAVETIAFSPDGKYLASGTRDGFLHVWLADTGERTGMTWLHSGPVTKVTFDPTSQWLATASRDHTARVCKLISLDQHAPIERLIRELECESGITIAITTDRRAASFSPPRPLSAQGWAARQEQLRKN